MSKHSVKKIFDHCAGEYDQYAAVFNFMADQMLERLAFTKIEPNVIVDLGCGTGYLAQKLAKQYQEAKVIAVDFSLEMLKQISSLKHQQEDLLSLSFETSSVDLITSNVALPFLREPTAFFTEVKRILKPDGLFVFTSLGPDTLKELKPEIADDFVGVFYDMHDTGDQLLQAGFQDPVMDMQLSIARYSSAFQAINEFQYLGIINPFIEFEEASKETIDITVEMIHGQAWNTLAKQKPNDNGEITFPIDWLKKI
jgi:malonyl-CoA O-methyltransferase